MSQSNRLGLLGRKVGMMRLFTDDGEAVPVTVVDVSNNRVTQVKTQENDGYVALQVTFGSRKASRVTKPQAGHLAKAGVEALAIPILPRRSGFDVSCLCPDGADPVSHGLCYELRAIVGTNEGWHTANDEQVCQRIDHIC